MKLDTINDIEWFREELKKKCKKLTVDLNEHFRKGEYYYFECSEAGAYLKDEKGNLFDLYSLSEINIDLFDDLYKTISFKIKVSDF